MNSNRLWIAVFLVTFTFLVVAGFAALTFVMKWSGPAFAAGCLCGYLLFFVYYKIKHGYWP